VRNGDRKKLKNQFIFLSFLHTQGDSTMAIDFNNDLFTATNLGILMPSAAPVGQRRGTTQTDSVSSLDDRNDFYKFRIDRSATVELALSNVSSATSIELIKNFNNSRFGDPGEIIDIRTISSGSGSFKIDGLGTGEYGIRVAKVGSGNANYTLNLNGIAGNGREIEPNNTFTNPMLVPGDLTANVRNYSGSVRTNGNDNDIYRFQVSQPSRFFAVADSSGQTPKVILHDAAGRVINFQNNQVGFSPRLDPGTYHVNVFGDSDYNLSLSGTPLSRAQLSVNVSRIQAIDSFDGRFEIEGDPDFYTKVTIDGETRQSRTIEGRKDARPDFTFTKDVGINKRLIPVKISVFDSDVGSDTRADINPVKGVRDLDLTFDSLTGTFTGQGVSVQQNGNVVTVQGSGDSDKAIVEFKMNYSTFDTAQSSTLSSLSVKKGSNEDEKLRGLDLNGILDGRSGDDKISGMGGDDILLGGDDDDLLRGGTGNDTLFGGKGNDTLIGGQGQDTFVLAPKTGLDRIRDFEVGVDAIGLVRGLTFDNLTIEQTARGALIRAGNDQLAVLQGVQANQISAQDFVSVDLTRFRGMAVPTLATSV
jgi:Ca2+-binding RTX toxin-like protein